MYSTRPTPLQTSDSPSPADPAGPGRPAPCGKRRRHGRSQDTTQGRRAARAGSGRDTTQRGVTKCTLLQYYGHQAQEMLLTNVSDTIHAYLLALFVLNIEIVLADVTKPEKSNILTLT